MFMPELHFFDKGSRKLSTVSKTSIVWFWLENIYTQRIQTSLFFNNRIILLRVLTGHSFMNKHHLIFHYAYSTHKDHFSITSILFQCPFHLKKRSMKFLFFLAKKILYSFTLSTSLIWDPWTKFLVKSLGKEKRKNLQINISFIKENKSMCQSPR